MAIFIIKTTRDVVIQTEYTVTAESLEETMEKYENEEMDYMHEEFSDTSEEEIINVEEE